MTTNLWYAFIADIFSFEELHSEIEKKQKAKNEKMVESIYDEK